MFSNKKHEDYFDYFLYYETILQILLSLEVTTDSDTNIFCYTVHICHTVHKAEQQNNKKMKDRKKICK